MSCSTDDPEYEISSADRELPQVQYEYLDHPADVQLHAWGESLEVAFEQVTMAMFAYMTDINTVTIESHMDVEVEGMDMQSLLYQLMDELLFNFCADPYFIPRVSRFPGSCIQVTDFCVRFARKLRSCNSIKAALR